MTSTHDGNIGGVRLITQRALHALTGQRVVSYQEAAHMVDGQELIISSDQITYVSLQQGAALRSEKDKESTDILKLYRDRNPEYNHLSLEEYFYKVYCREKYKSHNDVKRTKYRILMHKGMNCKPRYPIDYSYAKGMLILHKPWSKNQPLTAILKDKERCISTFKKMIMNKQLPSAVVAQYICAMKYSAQKRLEIIAKEGTQEPINLDRLSAEEREKYIAFQQCTHFTDNKLHDDKIGGMNVDIGEDIDWTTLRFSGERNTQIDGENWMNYTTKKFYKSSQDQQIFGTEVVIPKDKAGKEFNVDSSKEQREIVYAVMDTIIKFLTNDPSYKPLRATIMGCGGTGKSYVINTIISMIRQLTSSNDTIQIAAPSGSAAFNVQGSTLHRLLKIGVKHPEDPLSQKNRDMLTKQLERLLVLIIDERSQISSLNLAACERNLRECIYNGQNSNEYFGGLPVILLFGDDYQLMPVASEGAIQGYADLANYEVPQKKNTKMSKNALLMIKNGHKLFRDVMTENVFFLTKNYRVKCKRFRSLLDRVRVGEPSEEDIAAIMKLHLTFYSGDREFLNKIHNDKKTMFLFNNNADKDRMNNEKLVETCVANKMPVARLDCWYDTNKLQGGKERQPIKSHFDDRTRFISHTDLCVGARVSIVSHNFLPEVGLYNGAMGTIIEIVYKSNPVGPNDKEHRHLPDYVVVDFPHLALPSHIRPWDSNNPTVSHFRYKSVHHNFYRTYLSPYNVYCVHTHLARSHTNAHHSLQQTSMLHSRLLSTRTLLGNNHSQVPRIRGRLHRVRHCQPPDHRSRRPQLGTKEPRNPIRCSQPRQNARQVLARRTSARLGSLLARMRHKRSTNPRRYQEEGEEGFRSQSRVRPHQKTAPLGAVPTRATKGNDRQELHRETTQGDESKKVHSSPGARGHHRHHHRPQQFLAEAEADHVQNRPVVLLDLRSQKKFFQKPKIFIFPVGENISQRHCTRVSELVRHYTLSN